MEKTEIYDSLNKTYFSEDCDERRTLDALPPLLRNAKRFVDIGASLGQYTRYCNKHLNGAKMWAIEADPVRYEELARNCAQWQGESSNTIDVIHGAVSDQVGEIVFYTSNSTVSGGLFQHAVKSGDVEWQEVRVPACTLDSLFSNEPPDFIKIDVEGVELRVLKGSVEILKKKKTFLLVEVHSWADPQGQKNPREVLDFMKSHGYYALPFHGKYLFMPMSAEYLRRRWRSLFNKAKQRLLPRRKAS
ncbi:MAG: FkbM family methyltransferase [Sumerlaeia bacterium]